MTTVMLPAAAPRTPAAVDPLAAAPHDPSVPPPPHRPCDNPFTCGILGESDLCPPCRDLAEWERVQRERFAERERLASALSELEALCRHFPDAIAEALLPVLAEGIGRIVGKLGRGGQARG